MSHVIKKFSFLFLVGIIFLSIPHNFAQDIGTTYDISSFAPIMNDAPCVSLQYDLKPNSRDYYIYGNVMKLQMFLYQNDLMTYPPTGLYGNYTFNAVMNFQNKMGLPITGFVDLYTRMALAKASCGSSYNPNDFFVSQGYTYGNNSTQNTVVQTAPVNVNSNTTNQSQPGTSPWGYQTNTYYTPYVPVPVYQAATIYHCGLNNIDYGNQTSYNLGCVSSNTSNYTVTFISNSSVLYTQTIASGATAASPIAPTLSGYTFAGWYSDSSFNNLYNFSTPVTYNISLYAKWVSNYTGLSSPTNFVASNISSTGLTLTWSSVSGATGYQITGNNNFSSTVTSSTTIVLSGLTSNTSYTFNVSAFDGVSTSTPASLQVSTSQAIYIPQYPWYARGLAAPWYSVTSSADGTKLAAVSNGGYIYTSSDSGNVWIPQTGSGQRGWVSIDSSYDGSKLIAADGSNGYIYTSTDFGITWTPRTNAGQHIWYSVTTSSDGTKLAAVDGINGYIYTSNDSGQTWVARVNVGQHYWHSIASSYDGTKLAAVDGSNGYIYTSTDSGNTWTVNISSGQNFWISISSSSDGAKLVAVVYGGGIYTSTDSGATWTLQSSAGQRHWYSVTSSANGVKLAAVDGSNGYIYTSFDSGVTWNQANNGQHYWYSITSSADGVKIMAVDGNNGYMWANY